MLNWEAKIYGNICIIGKWTGDTIPLGLIQKVRSKYCLIAGDANLFFKTVSESDLDKAQDPRDFISGTNCKFQSGRHICPPITLYFVVNAYKQVWYNLNNASI